MGKIEILLADDDADDRSFFQEALSELAIPTKLTTVADGEQLTNYLSKVVDPPPPDIIFLDINMPYKNGKVCLREIRNDEKFKNIPIVMFSTSSQARDVDETYSYGANKYIFKSDFFENEADMLKKLFSPDWKEYLMQPTKEKFVLKAGN